MILEKLKEILEMRVGALPLVIVLGIFCYLVYVDVRESKRFEKEREEILKKYYGESKIVEEEEQI